VCRCIDFAPWILGENDVFHSALGYEDIVSESRVECLEFVFLCDMHPLRGQRKVELVF
jgi:hypothetical protein